MSITEIISCHRFFLKFNKHKIITGGNKINEIDFTMYESICPVGCLLHLKPIHLAVTIL